MDDSRVCPECRSEYLPHVEFCTDCQVRLLRASQKTLVSARPLPVTVAEADWDSLAPGVIAGQVASDRQNVVEVYLAHLKAAGIRAATVPETDYVTGATQLAFSPVFGSALFGGTAGQVPRGNVLEGFVYILFVPREEYERADRIIEDLFAALHPDQPNGFHAEFDLGTCPACGAAVAEDADECPDCGLALG